MAYERLNLKDGQVLTADHVKHLEDGIEAAGGGSVKWENMENRPFYAVEFSSEMSFESEPEDHFDALGNTWWKVSDFAPTTEQFLKTEIAFGVLDAAGNPQYSIHWIPGEDETGEILLDAENLTGIQSGEYGIGFAACRVAGEQSAEFMGNTITVTVPSVGLYFGYPQNNSVPAEYAVGVFYEEVKPLDAKFLPMDEIKEAVAPKVTSIDLTNFESNGTIVETYADGSTITYTMEFDADGNPIKVTDSNGNETVLTW